MWHTSVLGLSTDVSSPHRLTRPAARMLQANHFFGGAFPLRWGLSVFEHAGSRPGADILFAGRQKVRKKRLFRQPYSVFGCSVMTYRRGGCRAWFEFELPCQGADGARAASLRLREVCQRAYFGEKAVFQADCLRIYYIPCYQKVKLAHRQPPGKAGGVPTNFDSLRAGRSQPKSQQPRMAVQKTLFASFLSLNKKNPACGS